MGGRGEGGDSDSLLRGDGGCDFVCLTKAVVSAGRRRVTAHSSSPRFLP